MIYFNAIRDSVSLKVAQVYQDKDIRLKRCIFYKVSREPNLSCLLIYWCPDTWDHLATEALSKLPTESVRNMVDTLPTICEKKQTSTWIFSSVSTLQSFSSVRTTRGCNRNCSVNHGVVGNFEVELQCNTMVWCPQLFGVKMIKLM